MRFFLIGSAAAVAANEADVGIGTDSGGSVRTPASHCGLVGIKPTYGLLPQTGVLLAEPTLDHSGLLTRTVLENATALEEIAGPDGFDTSQDYLFANRTDFDPSYTKGIGESVEGMRIGLLEEGFDLPGSDTLVNAIVRKAIRTAFEALGVSVVRVSVPEHLNLGRPLRAGVEYEGSYVGMLANNMVAVGRMDPSIPGLAHAFSQWRQEPMNLPPALRLGMLTTEHVATEFGRSHFYGKAQNLRRKLRAAYDNALANVEALAMPGIGVTASEFPLHNLPADISLATDMRYSHPAHNFAQFNLSGHPAIVTPCGQILKTFDDSGEILPFVNDFFIFFTCTRASLFINNRFI